MATIEELQAQRNEIDRQIAEATVGPVTDAHTLLTGTSVTGLLQPLQTIRDGLPAGEARNQIGNVLVVLTQVPITLSVEIARLNKLLEPTPDIPELPGA